MVVVKWQIYVLSKSAKFDMGRLNFSASRAVNKSRQSDKLVGNSLVGMGQISYGLVRIHLQFLRNVF